MTDWKAEFDEVAADRDRWRDLVWIRTEERDKWMSTAEQNAHHLEQVIANLQAKIARLEKFEQVAERFYNIHPSDVAAMQFAYMAYEEARDGK